MKDFCYFCVRRNERIVNHIPITIDGKVESRIYSSQKVTDVAALLEKERDVFILHDSAVEGFASAIFDACPTVRGTMGIQVTEGEKDISTVTDVCGWLLECGATRESMLLAIGGGILTDIAGFAASIYKRGIRFSYVPTTLLAQVDAAIGGKTGVNFKGLKNILGIIRQPEFTFECPEVLGTLPKRELFAGGAELLKTFIIDNSDGSYDKAVSFLSYANSAKDVAQVIDSRMEDALSLIHNAAKVKASVVERDLYEKGERRNLNLGHTFAHAIESQAAATGMDIHHGEAVAIGTILASRLGEALGLSEKGLAEKLISDFSACGLPTECPMPLESLSQAMEKDKKASSGEVWFIIPEAVGKVSQRRLKVKDATEKIKVG